MGKKALTPPLQANVNYHNVAMGQGQDVVAMAKLDMGHKEGHWVMLQNVHLMPTWCKHLEKTMDNMALEGSHPNFRIFLSADPNDGIPIGILDRSIKLTNEPPQGLQANLRRAFALFTKEDFEERDTKVKVTLRKRPNFFAKFFLSSMTAWKCVESSKSSMSSLQTDNELKSIPLTRVTNKVAQPEQNGLVNQRCNLS